MHAYDVPRRHSLQSIPSARPAQEAAPSATPIYDALYAEYVRSFRSLPGDRSDEEHLGRVQFGNGAPRPGTYGGLGAGAYSAYSAGAHGSRHAAQQSPWQRVGRIGQSGRVEEEPGRTGTPDAAEERHQADTDTVAWRTRGGRHAADGLTHLPPALPPGPRASG